MPVEALKNTIGDPAGVGDWRSTFLATRAIFKLFSLRTIPRLMRWLKNSLFMMSPNLISKFRYQKSHLFRHYQSLFFSYPSLTSRSPAISLNRFLCSSVKCCFHPPVFPERNVWLFLGWMASIKMGNAFSRGVGIL